MRTGPVVLNHGDCVKVMRELPDASVDSVVTDPPYGLGFLGREWDAVPPGREWAEGCLRVLRPGGHLLAFGGTRTWHRLACAVEDAGFEVRDSIAWLYGTGFPKSLDVSKAIDRAAGAEREVIGQRSTHLARPITESWERSRAGHKGARSQVPNGNGRLVADVTAPATDAARTWQGWGTALKPAFEPIVVARKPLAGTVAASVLAHGTGALNVDGCRVGERWPPNVALDESCADTFPASCFMYVAKAATSERPKANGVAHPTVKPLALMRWLVRLVTPPGGTVLDPFAGSGTTVEAAILEGFASIGIEREADYLPLIQERIFRAQAALAETEPTLFDEESA